MYEVVRLLPRGPHPNTWGSIDVSSHEPISTFITAGNRTNPFAAFSECSTPYQNYEQSKNSDNPPRLLKFCNFLGIRIQLYFNFNYWLIRPYFSHLFLTFISKVCSLEGLEGFSAKELSLVLELIFHQNFYKSNQTYSFVSHRWEICVRFVFNWNDSKNKICLTQNNFWTKLFSE